MKIKILFFFTLFTICFSSCIGLNKQVKQIKALEDCKFEIKSADSISIANVDITNFIVGQKIDFGNLPMLALALLRKETPLKARLNLVITNPGGKLAAINQFEYKVFIRDRELASGIVNQKIAIDPNGGVKSVPVQINSDIYELISDRKIREAVTKFLTATADNGNHKEKFTLKIKPTLDFGNEQLKYPGYITIEKEFGRNMLFGL